jgi:TonB family protein
MEVSLVSLPTPMVPSEPIKSTEPVKLKEPTKVSDPKPAPKPVVKAAVPSAIPSVAPPVGEKRRDMLRDLQLPPDAPKFGDVSPATPSVAQPQQAAKVKVLDIPHIPDVVPEPVAKVPQRSSVSDDVNRELEEELKNFKQFKPMPKLDIPKEVKPSEMPVKPVPQQEAKASPVKAPEMTLRISGAAAGSNSYWTLVQSLISRHWEPTPIDMTGQTYTMIVKFRIQRDGTIKNVVIQQSSGNAYLDLAALRAVQKTPFLPAFPAAMAESYQDVEMLFRVGESVG